MRKLLLARFVLLAAALLISPEPVSAAAHCRARRAEIIDHLKQQYSEKLIVRGLSAEGQFVFEFWANPATGTWTIVGHMSGGVTCIHASGTDFEQLPAALGTAV